MKVAQQVAEWILANREHVDPHVYMLCGAGAMHLNDAFCHTPGIKVTAMHHEQAAVFAAEAHARTTGKPPIVCVTAGPGATNAITGIACAYVDSIPMIVIAGTCTNHTRASRVAPELRQLGVNELDITRMVGGITKWALTAWNPAMIVRSLDAALGYALSGRPGPAFVEIPLDVQGMDAPGDVLGRSGFRKEAYVGPDNIRDVANALSKSSRPVLLIGNGVRLAGGVDDLRFLVDRLGLVPVLSTWGAHDILDNDHPCYIGRPGIFGDRAGNFAIENCDLLLAIGTRLSYPITGHHRLNFAPNAYKIGVDIDCNELRKKRDLELNNRIVADAGHFARELACSIHETFGPQADDWRSWWNRCVEWRKRYPVMQDEYRESLSTDGLVNSYHAIEVIAHHAPENTIFVTDVGAAYISAMQSLKLKPGQRLMHSGGVSPMGWGLPAAIGAAIAGEGHRPVVCLTGDGGLMLNLQELQTVWVNRLPVSIFVFENSGYLTMRHTQNQHFGRESVSGNHSGLSMPDFEDIANAFGITPNHSPITPGELEIVIKQAFSVKRPTFTILHMPDDQVLAPRIRAKTEHGQFLPVSYADLWPHLPDDELAANLLRTPDHA